MTCRSRSGHCKNELVHITHVKHQFNPYIFQGQGQLESKKRLLHEMNKKRLDRDNRVLLAYHG